MCNAQNVPTLGFPSPDPLSSLIVTIKGSISVIQEVNWLQQAFQVRIIASEEFAVFSLGRAKQCWGLSWECF